MQEKRVTLPAMLDAVEAFCLEFRRWRASNCECIDAFGAELLLREALTNAVVHGCPESDGKKILCILRVKRQHLLIVVKDEGRGFNWRSVWRRKSAPSDPNGRGMEIFKSYANCVHFNPSGNIVTLLKRSQTGVTE